MTNQFSIASKSRETGRLTLFRLIALAVVAMLPCSTTATITVLDSGKRYASRQDRFYGPLFWKGYQYMARLQYVEDNLSLCPEPFNRTHTLQTPVDNLPVALLVRSGGCTLKEKVEYIKQFVRPASVVNFLIVDGSSYIVEGVDGGEDDIYFEGTSELDEQELVEGMSKGNIQLFDAEEAANVPATIELAGEQDQLERRQRKKHRDQVSVPMHILHVTSRVHYQLLDIVVHQSRSSYHSGGVRISMDSRTSTMDSSTALWIAFSALMGACCCSCALILSGNRSDWLVIEQPAAPQQNTRPQRRRLTKEQVKRLFPIYQFDGERLEPLENMPLVNNQEASGDQQDGDVESSDVLRAFVPEPLELELCSICLDEYEPGDRLRCLDPCHHAFHSKCIGRWLSERSATCPLCKTELYDPEEEGEEEEGDEEEQQGGNEEQSEEQNQEPTNPENNGIATVPSRFFYAFNPRSISVADEEAPVDQQETDRLVTVEEEDSSPTPLELADNASTVVVEQRRSWWRRTRRTFRRLFTPSSSNSNGVENMEGSTVSLTQPLLTTNTSESGHGSANLMVPLESTINTAHGTLGEDPTTSVVDPAASSPTERGTEQPAIHSGDRDSLADSSHQITV
eukprot:CAMPEP_0172459624 /NCGR_PEP_ID=MMETSP1065-20121228/33397_1 /TAXON_ID=265537 /ORGANISM="Amphiprora paludosa, Strain CCMP125" /LENGTH=623 /DNA_ID=CAMNT_0013214371 /DNA_START=319 /DNA_END=2190 /DNA_ORIENTATION=-